MPVTLTTFTDVMGCSLPTVRAAIRRGMPTLGRTGREHRIDLRAGVRWWLQDLETRHQAELEDVSDDPAIAAARRRKLEAEASLREQELGVSRGELMPVAVAERVAFESARTIREALFNIPSRLATELAGETSTDRIFERLDTEIRLACEAAADRIRPRKRGAA